MPKDIKNCKTKARHEISTFKLVLKSCQTKDFVQQTGRYIKDLAGRLGIWQADWGSGRSSILGIWQVYWGYGRYIGDLARILGIWHVCWGSGTYIGDLARRLVNYNWWTLYNDLSSLSTSAELSKLSFFTFHSKNCFTKISVSLNLLKRNLNPVRLV